MLTILLVSTSAPAVAGEWSDDTWLENIIGPERLENGDEFGCHGYEGVSTVEENWVIEACKDYLIRSTNASRWGSAPISFGIPETFLDDETAEQLASSGFMIVGDKLSETPTNGLILAPRITTSMEKGVADTSLIESAEEDALVSIYWRARIDDLRVREDKDAIAWLENQPYWFTTWGEWNLHRLASQTITTALGGRQVEDGILLTQAPGTTLTIELDTEPNTMLSNPMTTFNDHHHAVTIVGHHTTNLFQWTADFVNSELVFTCLIERPAGVEKSWFLPALALTILIATPLSIRYLIKKDAESH